MVKREFDSSKNILFVDNSGRLEFESMKEYFSSLSTYANITPKLFIFEDATQAKVKFSSEHLIKLSKTLNQVAKQYDEVFHAVLLKDTKNVAYAMMINDLLSEDNYHLKVFSDIEMASDWVKNT